MGETYSELSPEVLKQDQWVQEVAITLAKKGYVVCVKNERPTIIRKDKKEGE